MKVWKNFNQIITLSAAHQKDGRKLLPEDLGIIENGTIVFDDTKIIWIGKNSELPKQYSKIVPTDCAGKILLPELVDSHTHLVFGGDRSKEYVARLNGATYEDIAKMGGGISYTSEQTRSLITKPNYIFEKAVERIEKIHSYGVGTIEIKSGYGLTYDSEKELSLLIDRLKKYFCPKIQIKNTFMAAHAIPKGQTSIEYIQKVCIPLLNELAPLNIIDAVDIFEEDGYFSRSDTIALFNSAKVLKLPVKIHADEFNDNKTALFAANINALSADHLLATTQDGINALANSQTVATLLPGTAFFLGKKPANARGLLDSGVKVAIASDYNPGSCHIDNLLLVARIAGPNLKMNITELLAAITLNAAHALGLKNQGAIIADLAPRFTVYELENFEKLFYCW